MATRPPVSLKLSRRSRILLIIAAVIVLALLLGVRLLDTYVDWLWFGEVHARSVFTTELLTRIVLFVAVGLLVGGSLAISLIIAYRTRPVFVPVSGSDDPLSRYRSMIVSRIRLFGIGIPVITGLISGASAMGDWQTIQLFLNGTSFGQKDPQFGIDIGFYAFTLPFVNWLLGWLFVTVVVSFFGALIAHYIFGGIRLAGRGGQLAGPTRAQLAITVGIFVLLKAVEYFFDRYNLLLSDRDMPLFNGATYTDLNAVLPAKLILLCISVICAIAFFAGAFLRNLQLPAIALVLLILSGVLVGVAWPAILDQFSVKPNANDKEATSIQRNMDATRSAFGLTNVKYEDYKGSNQASQDQVKADTGTVSNIRLLDPNVLSDTYTQLAGGQNYYGFPAKLDIDRYTVNGSTQDYIVAAKEIKTDGLTGNQTNWITKHLVYTHGNGFVAAPANTINRAVTDVSDTSSAGYPLIGTSDTKNPTGAGSVGGKPGIKVDQPRIYYGELADQNDYAIVGGTPGKAPGESDSPDQKNYYYNGTGGVPLDNWFNRLAFAAEYGERNILFSDAIGDGSKIMYNRTPRERVSKVAPWLTLDGDPYPAVVNGKIVWIVDGYTTLNNYPYAQQTQLGDATNDSLNGVTRQANNSINYIRNSVKATVDAFDGTVTLYSIDDKEPVLNAWEKVFPGLVKPSSEIPPDLRAHFRYPEDLFKVQRELLARYHVDNPQQFYAQQSFWSVPQDPTEDGSATTAAANVANQPGYYVLADAAGEGTPTFQLTSGLTGLQRQYLASWMSVSSDPGDYGTIRVLRLPTITGANQVDGPVQVQNRFQSDQQVASDRTLLNNPNVIPIYGNMITLPVADGFLYVEPVYIRQRNQLSYPQLARILVSFGSKVGYAPTLNEALDQVFGKGTGVAATTPVEGTPPSSSTPPTSTSPTTPTTPPANSGGSNPALDKAVTDIQSALAKLKAAQQSGNFADQGTALAALDDAAKRYEAAKPATPPSGSGAPQQPGG